MKLANLITTPEFILQIPQNIAGRFVRSFITVLMILVPVYSWSETANTSGKHSLSLSMTTPESWIVDTVHLGNRQLTIGANTNEHATLITPLWSDKDIDSKELGVSNVDSSKLHVYQLIPTADCSQSESYFEIQIPKDYISEGKMELVFSLQAGEKGDYMFNGRKFTMADFKDNGTRYKKIIVKAIDFNEPLEKLRAIERVNFIFHRNGSNISLPIKIRRVSIHFNQDKITPILPDIKVQNPHSFYHFKYDTQKAVDGIFARVSSEDLDITRTFNPTKKAMTLTPQWGPTTLPNGHSGKVTLVQALGAIHDFERFEIQYLLNIPKAYFIEGKLDVYLFIQAGETGYGRWSGSQRLLASFQDKADQDVILRLTEEDFKHHGKKRNQIEFVGLQLNPHGSTILEPITLKSIRVKLPEPTYACVPFHDSVVKNLTQTIPGRIQNEYYDVMDISDSEKQSGKAEGICYHDEDNINSGSGNLNKTGSYLKEFRMFESPDISYTKFNNPDVPVDDTVYNVVAPENNSLYLGWISPGEWVNYTVTVKKTGYYSITTLYTSKLGGYISFEVNNKDISGPLHLPLTYNAADPIEWRQAHHWNKVSKIGKIYLESGTQVLTLHFLGQPVMNFDYMDFEEI